MEEGEDLHRDVASCWRVRKICWFAILRVVAISEGDDLLLFEKARHLHLSAYFCIFKPFYQIHFACFVRRGSQTPARGYSEILTFFGRFFIF